MSPGDERMQRVVKLEKKVRALRSAALCVFSMNALVLVYLAVHLRIFH